MLERLITEALRARQRSWNTQTTGGLLMGLVLAALAGGVLVDRGR